jgi:hypothetical protein
MNNGTPSQMAAHIVMRAFHRSVFVENSHLPGRIGRRLVQYRFMEARFRDVLVEPEQRHQDFGGAFFLKAAVTSSLSMRAPGVPG